MNKFALIYLLLNVVFTLRCLIKAFRDDISTKTDCITMYTFRSFRHCENLDLCKAFELQQYT